MDRSVKDHCPIRFSLLKTHETLARFKHRRLRSKGRVGASEVVGIKITRTIKIKTKLNEKKSGMVFFVSTLL